MVSKIPLLAIENLMKKYGAERVSDSAKEYLRKVVEKKLEVIAIASKEICEFSNRKTILVQDILVAIKSKK